MAYNQRVQHSTAEMYVDILTAGTPLEATAVDWAAGVPQADWPDRILAAAD